VGGTSEQLPEGSFQDPSLPVTTGVNARLVVVDKPAETPTGSGIRFNRRAEFEGAQNDSPPRGATPIDQLFTPLAHKQADRIVQMLLRDMATEQGGSAPTAITVARFSELPPAIQQAAYDQGATDKDISAVWTHDAVYFVAENLEGDRRACHQLSQMTMAAR
jgi:hypothetical protein